jgi:phage terminase large subunit-like protein
LNRELGAALDFFDILSIKDCMKSLKKEDYFDTYAVGGVDLAETTDLCNATAMILKPNGKMLILQAYFMAEQRIAKNSAHDREDYKLYENMATDDIVTSQILIPTPGDYVAKEYVTKWFEMLRDEYKINFLKIGYDPWGAKEWLTDMYNNGFSIEQVKSDKESHVTARDDGIMTEVRQGSFTLSEAIKIVKTLFDDQKIVYDKNNKLLPYCFYNLKLHADSNNNLSPQKSKSRGHIDGAMGIFDAFVGYQRAKALEEYSVLVDYFKI